MVVGWPGLEPGTNALKGPGAVSFRAIKSGVGTLALDICQKICQCEDVKHQTTSGNAKKSGSKGRAPLSTVEDTRIFWPEIKQAIADLLDEAERRKGAPKENLQRVRIALETTTGKGSIAIVFDEVGQESSWQNKVARQLNQLLARVDVLKGEARAALLSIVERVAEFESIAKLSGRDVQAVPLSTVKPELLNQFAEILSIVDAGNAETKNNSRWAIAHRTLDAAQTRKFFRYQCDACGNNTWLADAAEKFIYCAHCNEGTRGGLTTSDVGRLTVVETLNFIQTGGAK